MAVLWKEKSGESILEVRSAGATRRLYCDGVLHTQYNPKHVLTGDVWDPMGLAPAAAPEGGIQSALILGLGGGAVVHQLREFFNVPRITAVELDAKRIMLGRKYFGLDMPGVDLKHADAIEFVNKYKGPPFDLVIDDLFQHFFRFFDGFIDVLDGRGFVSVRRTRGVEVFLLSLDFLGVVLQLLLLELKHFTHGVRFFDQLHLLVEQVHHMSHL